MNPYNFSVLCFGFCSLLLGLFVWLKRQDQIGKLYFFVSLCYAGWALPFAIKISDNVSYYVALHAARIANCSAAFIPTVWFHFCLVYTQRRQIHTKLLRAFYGVPVLILAVAYTPWFVTGLRPILGFKYYATPGIFYYLMTLNYFLIVPLGFWQLITKIKEVPANEKGQIWGLFWAAFIGYVGGATTFFPIYGIEFPQEGMFLLPIYPFALAYVMTRKKLFDAEALAQAAHRDKLTAIGVLAASINHEVRNPLYVIKGLAESCLERQKEGVFPSKEKALDSANDAFKRTMEQADRAMDIIKRLSLFAKAGIESELKFEPVRVADVLEDILPLIRYELAANSIGLTREIPKDLPDVCVDRRYLEEILFNLLVNAIQAIKTNSPSEDLKVNWASPGNLQSEKNSPNTIQFPRSGNWGNPDCRNGKENKSQDRGQGKGAGKPGEIRITATSPGLGVHSKTGTLEGDKVIITIQDTGPGIPEDKLRDVFRPFYTTKEEGTGLGLYITQQLVEKIRGRIKVESELGKGTTFTVILPAT